MQNTKENIAEKEIDRLHQITKSLILSTKTSNNSIETSYAPYAFYNNNYYILISELAPHTENVKINPEINILLIEDEGSAKNIFARARLSYSATARSVGKNTDEFNQVAELLKERAGKTVDLLLGLGDFSLFKIEPDHGRLIIGFGQAYLLDTKGKKIIHVDKDLVNKDKTN